MRESDISSTALENLPDSASNVTTELIREYDHFTIGLGYAEAVNLRPSNIIISKGEK